MRVEKEKKNENNDGEQKYIINITYNQNKKN